MDDIFDPYRDTMQVPAPVALLKLSVQFIGIFKRLLFINLNPGANGHEKGRAVARPWFQVMR